MFRISGRQFTPAPPLFLILALFLPCLTAAETVSYSISIPPCRIVPEGTTQRVELDGYGTLAVPGHPVLPFRKILLALPPGAQVQSATVTGIGDMPVPGSFRLETAPALEPLAAADKFDAVRARMRNLWQTNHDAVYTSNNPYPVRVGYLAGFGTLRQYAYAAVAVCPCQYSPLSGTLQQFTTVRIELDYTLPAPSSVVAQHLATLPNDPATDRLAARLFSNFAQMRPRYPVSVPESRVKAETANYVIITTDALRPGLANSGFVAWKQSLGFTVQTVLVSDPEITSQTGLDLAAKIRNFLRAQYGPWGIEYVLFIGDPSAVPMRYCFPDPENHWDNAGTPSSASGEVPTDFYYADLSATDETSWDLDQDGFYGEWGEDSPDFLAEIAVGRIPTNITGRITYCLDKLVAFEQDDGDWKRHALLAGAMAWFDNENGDERPLKDLATCLNDIETDLMSDWNVDHLSEQAGLVPSTCVWSPLNDSSFYQAWRNGQYGIVNWGGHGWCNSVHGKYWEFDDGDNVPESYNPDEIVTYPFFDTGYFMDDDYPSIVFALSCLVGYPEPTAEGNLGVDLMTRQGFGAAAGMVSGSRVIWVSRGGGEQYCYEFNRFLIDGPDGPEKLGDAFYHAAFHVDQTYDWDHFASYSNMYCINLYGDPAMVWQGISDDPEGPPPTACCLQQNYPNPFNPETHIPFELNAPAHVTLSIYSLAGKFIRTVVSASYGVGRFTEPWDGCDSHGERVASGTYFYRIQMGDFAETRRLAVVR